MRTSLVLLILCLPTLRAAAQPDFSYEPGAWTDLNGQVHEGLILNLRWADNPAQISFKASRSDAPRTIGAAEIAAFRIGESMRYEGHAVRIDIPVEMVGRVSTTRNPEWKADTLLLRVMAEGSVSLYAYQQADLVRYFIRTADGQLEQLIYKRYITPEQTLKINQAFAGQLQIRLACEGALPPAQAPRYDGRYLKAAFRSYYACQGETGRIYPNPKTRPNIHVRIVPMLRMSSASFSYELGNQYAAEYSRQPAVALGADVEYLLSVLRWRLALCAELAVQQFSGTAGNERWQDIQLRYRSLEMLLGLRVYPFSRPGRAFHPYLTAGYMTPVAVLGDSYISYPFGYKFEISPNSVPCFAAGMCYKRFGGELRYYLPQDVLTAENAYWTTSFQSFGIAVSFQLF